MSRRIRGLLIVCGVIGALIGLGVWLGHRESASKTPCQRYAALLDRVLDNCHSGASRDAELRIAECEQSLDPSPRCLRRIEELSCEELERGPVVSAGDACSPAR